MIRHIKIDGLQYEVREVDEIESGVAIMGTIDDHSLYILIKKNQHSQSKLLVLWHEALHGANSHLKLGFNEDTMHRLACATFALIVNNPQFVEDIIKESER